MKKTLCCGLILLLALLLGCAAAQAETTTLLVYLCGTDLQDAGCEDMAEMAEADLGENGNVVVLAGGAKEWEFDFLGGNTRTLVEIRDGDAYTADWGGASMGSAESLLEFLSYGLENYPADRTVVVLWNHGAGSEGGVCFDETANDDSLTVAEISAVLASLPQDRHINIFGCDACMMGTYEMAAMLSHYNIGYYVASEELEPGSGWDYAAWMSALKASPAASDEEICAGIIDTYLEAGTAEDPDACLTLSAVKLSEVGALESCMERFAGVLSGELERGNMSAVRRGRSRMYAFGSFHDASWDMVDLGAMLDAYAGFDAETAAEARRCLSRAVVFSAQTDNLEPCCGMSVLLPQDTAASFDHYREGLDLAGLIPGWTDFVATYAASLTGGSHTAGVTGATQLTEGAEPAGSFVSFSWLGSCLSWDDESESYGGESAAEEYAITDSDQGFTVTLSEDDLMALDDVEGMLLLDVSDEESTAYVDFGTMRNNLIDWSTGTVVSLYDGTWPFFGGQPVPMYDQAGNDRSRRSLIPVKLNGEYTYLVAVFPAGSAEGRILGASAGYDENGLPVRKMTRLQPGDEIIPVYTMYVFVDDEEEPEETEFDGEVIRWQEGMTVTYEDLSTDDSEESLQMLFAFVFNDIYGGSSLSDIIPFEL